jgi:flagellar biosynthesis component FlhA
MKNNNSGCIILSVFIFAILAICLVPLCFIWSLNTLFNFNIEYSFVNFMAALILCSIFSGKNVKTSKSD